MTNTIPSRPRGLVLRDPSPRTIEPRHFYISVHQIISRGRGTGFSVAAKLQRPQIDDTLRIVARGARQEGSVDGDRDICGSVKAD